MGLKDNLGEKEALLVIYLDGPFKFYLCNEKGYWNIFFILFFQDFNGEFCKFHAKAPFKEKAQS